MAVIWSPVSGENTVDLNVDSVLGLLYADLVTIYRGADITLQFPELERSYGEWGALIKEGRIPAAAGSAVDKNATSICGPYYFEADSRVYQDWVERKYVSELRRVDVTKVLRGEEEYADLLRRIAQRNLEGYRRDVNDSMNSAFAYMAESTPTIPALVVYDDIGDTWGDPTSILGSTNRLELLDNGATFEDLYTEILSRAINMTRDNSIYTEGNDVYGARMEDLVVYIPDEVLANADIRYLQTLFNLRGIDMLPTIKGYDQRRITPASGEYMDKDMYAIIIMDKYVLNHVTRYMDANDDRIGCRESVQIGLFVEDMVKYSPLYKAWAIVTPMPAKSAQ